MKIYIKGIGIQNFKTYSKYQFCEFSSITFLIGKNGVGKSSFLQAAHFIFKYLENATSFRYFHHDEFKMIKNEKIVFDDVYSENFTHITQFINDISKPLIIDLLIDFGYEKNNFIICPLKYRFIFTVKTFENEQILFLNKLNIFNKENDELLFINDYNEKNESYNIDVTKEGIIFLLSSFFKYINHPDLPQQNNVRLKDLFQEENINEKKNEFKDKFENLKAKYLYEIDEVKYFRPAQQFGQNEELLEICLFNDEITSCFSNCSDELKKILNLSYQAIKESFEINKKRLQEIEIIKISEISSRKRTLNKNDIFLKCFSNVNTHNIPFIKNNLERFNFKGTPEKMKVSKDDTDYKVILSHKNQEKINLIDEGSGYWVLTYLILILGNESNKNKIVLIEEPESNLHPNFQSNLADLFIEAAETFNLQLIIETHSEYLIKRLQRRISQTFKKEKLINSIFKEQQPIPFNVYPSDVSINYIHDISLSNDIVNIEIDKNGELDRPFPPDFMDVALNEDLLSFKLKNLN